MPGSGRHDPAGHRGHGVAPVRLAGVSGLRTQHPNRGRPRRALEHRDGGCSFPGCTTRRHVDAHHVVHWADGGETKLENLVLLCRHHHRLVHEGGYAVALLASGEARFRDPRGTVVPPAPASATAVSSPRRSTSIAQASP